MLHQMKLRNTPFVKIKEGSKKVELRLYDEKRQLIKEGDVIEFTNVETEEKLSVNVVKLNIYNSFKELYENMNITLLGYSKEDSPCYTDMEEYYSKEEQQKYGVVGIEISVILK
ncbi:MAG: ASCH domain-containing protein [Clostridia bacterium]|nr:ASCH domain-containing protein [Clostridia bacterium]